MDIRRRTCWAIGPLRKLMLEDIYEAIEEEVARHAWTVSDAEVDFPEHWLLTPPGENQVEAFLIFRGPRRTLMVVENLETTPVAGGDAVVEAIACRLKQLQKGNGDV